MENYTSDEQINRRHAEGCELDLVKYKPQVKKGAESEEAPLVFDFIDDLDAWKRDWVGMPEFIQEDLAPWKQVIVSFENRESMEAFGKLIGQKVQFTTRSLWYPEAEIGRIADKRYSDG